MSVKDRVSARTPPITRGSSLSADRQDDLRKKFVYATRFRAVNYFKSLNVLGFLRFSVCGR